MVSPKYWLGCLLCGVSFAAGHEAVITVNPAQIVGKVNPLILGNNQLAYPGRPEYAKYGSGLWDPDKRAPVPEYVALSREAGITIQRWPGGCIAHNYNWKKTVGPLSERPDMLWGLPEFMTFCEATGSLPLITLAVYWGDQNDAADIVEYLNSPVGKNPNGGKDWAAVRAADGHPQPYGVVYFEYGNEDYHGEHKTADNPNPRKITPEDYAKQYLAYQKAMKAVDPKIRLAGLLQYGLWDWNKAVLAGCGKQMDYAIDHTYTPGFQGDTTEEKGHAYMLACLAADAHIQDIYDRLHAQIKEVCGRTNMQLAITEYNGWFVQEKPAPYRQAFGNALRNAEHLRVMMRPQNRILMGNFWQFANEYWGMVKGYVHKGETPVKQANFFPYQMYHEHFGDTLIGVQVQCGNWDFMGGPLPARKGKPTEFIPWDKVLRIEEDLMQMGPAVKIEIQSAKGTMQFWVFQYIEQIEEQNPGLLKMMPQLNPGLFEPYLFVLQAVEGRYFSGIQVARDPGAPVVAGGSVLLVAGLIVAFFSSHRRIWVRVDESGGRTRVSAAGLSSKDAGGLDREIRRFLNKVRERSSAGS